MTLDDIQKYESLSDLYLYLTIYSDYGEMDDVDYQEIYKKITEDRI